MIANNEQLQLVKQQAARMESALESLARTVRPRSETQYRIFAEGYVDQLAILRADIDEYLGLAAVKSPQPEVEVSVEDPGAALGDTRVSAVTKLVDRFRKALRTTVVSVRDSLSMMDRENVTNEFLDRLCDPPLQAIAGGSVKVQLAAPHLAVGNDLYAEGMKLLSLAIRAVGGEAEALRELRALPANQQKAALTAAKILAPEKGDLVGQVGLSGRFLGRGHIQFTPTTRKRILRQLSRLARQSITKTARGVIREVDLDRRLFSLREPETGATVERCKYGKPLDSQVAQLVNKPVQVTGLLRSNGLRATRLRVRNIVQVTSE